MGNTPQRKRNTRKTKRKRSRPNPSQELLTTEPTPIPPGSIPLDPRGRPACPPGTSLALSVSAAWRRLCARTGCNVGLACVYRWIYQGRINSVRMGKKIFIRAEVLDQLVNDALQGERW